MVCVYVLLCGGAHPHPRQQVLIPGRQHLCSVGMFSRKTCGACFARVLLGCLTLVSFILELQRPTFDVRTYCFPAAGDLLYIPRGWAHQAHTHTPELPPQPWPDLQHDPIPARSGPCRACPPKNTAAENKSPAQHGAPHAAMQHDAIGVPSPATLWHPSCGQTTGREEVVWPPCLTGTSIEGASMHLTFGLEVSV